MRLYLSILFVSLSFLSPIKLKTNDLKVKEGFVVEHLYKPSQFNHGSWVSMTFDPKGRIIASDQFGSLYRMEIPAIGSGEKVTNIEKLSIEGDSIGMGMAQGLLWFDNSLYVMVNHRDTQKSPRKSGLYKLEDTNGDDVFDKYTHLKYLHGEGEHGPHSIIASPDGESIYVIAGNHTDAPEMDSYRLPKNWQHDHLYPFIKDPRGHATDRTEPGGWIAKVDTKTNHWEFVSGGYRNPYDIAFNEAGDLFTYDSDMEWEFGMPWYRPTRICHVSSGSEYGWRTASGKWPVTFEDNLSPVLNIGQGSPTNLVSLKNAAFPEKYKNTLLAFDWSFGIIHTIHLKAQGSSYTAEREEFLSGIPLPLTDGVIGPDGALYFMTGGRRLESDLYRVHYTGTDIKKPSETRITEENKIRRNLETFHEGPHPNAITEVWPYLEHTDRFLRYAARIAVEHQPIAEWKDKALTEPDQNKQIYALMALVRQGKPELKQSIYTALSKINYDALSAKGQLDLLRVYELFFARMGQPTAVQKPLLSQKFGKIFPTKDDDINRQLAKLLVYLDAPGTATKILGLIESKEALDEVAGGETATSSADLILRNPQYGMDIAAMLEKLPPARQTYYAILLSELKTGWTPALHERYFKWFRTALNYKGGLSYIGFIDRAQKNALKYVAPNRVAYYKKLAGADLLTASGNDVTDITYPKGPGKSWKVDNANALFADGLKNRDFVQGKNMYMATMCSRCHTMRGEGVNLGPDLTQLGTRFSTRDILEAIIEPNATISDQYASTQFQLKNGESIVGRIVADEGDHYKIVQNPFTPNLSVKVLKRNVVSKSYSSVSMMLPGLINGLNEEELKDLMAFLVAGGNQNHDVFK